MIPAKYEVFWSRKNLDESSKAVQSFGLKINILFETFLTLFHKNFECMLYVTLRIQDMSDRLQEKENTFIQGDLVDKIQWVINISNTWLEVIDCVFEETDASAHCLSSVVLIQKK